MLATAATWRELADYPLGDRRTLAPRVPTTVEQLRIEAFAVEHAVRAPTVALRIDAGDRAVLYAPDVVDITDRHAALAGCELYIGDGTSLTRSHVRRTGGALVGHTTVRAQLGWCAEAGVGRAMFTHCGREIVAGDDDVDERLWRMGRERNVDASFADDGLEIDLTG